MHADDRDYTYYSSVHRTYSRIDFFLIQPKDLPLITSSQIVYISFSDHAPTHVTMCWDTEPRAPPTRKLNESLLQIPEVREEIAKILSNYFSENADASVSPMLIWEAHKCVVRGELIRIGALKKRERNRQIALLIS